MPRVRAWFVMAPALAAVALAASAGPAPQPPPSAPASTPPPVCRAAPRTYDELQTLFAAPIGPIPLRPPGPLPSGEPADAETVVGITATVNELVACWNAGTLLAAYGLYTDAYLRRLLDRQGPPDRAAYAFFATPRAGGSDEPTVIVAIERVRLLDDRRVGAIVVLRYPKLPVDKTFFMVFVRADDRWRIDDILGEISFAVP